MRKFRSAIVLFCFWLVSCTTMQPASQTPQNEKLAWDNRVQTLSGIETWDLKGLIALREMHSKDDGTATLQWQQQHHHYHIALFGPLGSNSMELTGQPGRVELASANGKHFYANSPEQLLAQQTGWVLPVSNLYYWVRGIPVPNTPAEKEFDSYHHLTVLRQQGWTIQYLRYTSVRNIDVPSKIFLNNPDMNVKIVINQWQF